MDNAVWGMLNDAEKALLRETTAPELTGLDEDALAALHQRVRRARDKYTKLYRRRAAEQVTADRSRKRAHAQHARTLIKAEAFEEALERTSRALARAAKASAAQLKAERLAAAQASHSGAAASGRAAPTQPEPTGGAPRTRRTPASEKRRASIRATGARRQAKRDAR